ncbi:MAG TPA: bifunctional 4-hydroxy-2-oxoglutarate aldolase/2-dehydro-3-deoxy-phosphogluconate aldolase [Terriglobales bacterium]|nr:bifunctional 4-hydroxy-2-oxoglutarate aldolase/2-dehydro-3-deoxy-phosphogluconate aldolase [Terriglobales bacterium]
MNTANIGKAAMTKQEVRERILSVGVIPVVRAKSARHAMVGIEAISEGGIPIAEITMTVPGAISLIEEVVKRMGSSVLVGAGTVLDASTARQCADAGAQFLVSPGFDLATVEFARDKEILMMAGALTPTEVMAVWKSGADFVKVFPCGEVGGAKYIRALRGPFPEIPMVPTGGVSLKTAAEFIRAGASALGVGGELVSAAALESGDAKIISDNARAFVAAVQQARTT